MELLKEVVNFFRFTTYLFDVTHHYDVLQKAVIRLLEAISKEASLENSGGSAHLSPEVMESLCEVIAVMPDNMRTQVAINQFLFGQLAENPAPESGLVARMLKRIADDVVNFQEDTAFLECGKQAVLRLKSHYPQAVQAFAAQVRLEAGKAGSPGDGLSDLLSFFHSENLL